MSKERQILSQILKSWAQDHNTSYQIAAPEAGDEGVENTGVFFSWLIKHEIDTNIDLISLLDRLELYVDSLRRKKHPDGLHCCKCNTFYQYAESNQPDGTLLCYSCRFNPYC